MRSLNAAAALSLEEAVKNRQRQRVVANSKPSSGYSAMFAYTTLGRRVQWLRRPSRRWDVTSQKARTARMIGVFLGGLSLDAC